MNAQQLLCHVSILWFLSFRPQSSSRTQSQQYAEPPALPNGWQIASVSTGQSPGTGEEQGWFPTLFWIYLGPHSPSKLKCPPFWDTSIFALYIHDFAFYFLNFIYSWLCWVFSAVGGAVLSLVAVSWGLLSICGVCPSHCKGFSCWRAWTLGLELQQLWHMGLVVLECVESSQTRVWTHVPCIGRQIRNHWTTREVYQCLDFITF